MPLIQSAESLEEILNDVCVSRIALTAISGRCGSSWLASEIRALGENGLGIEALDPAEVASWNSRTGLDLFSLSGFKQWLKDQSCGGVVWIQVGVEQFDLFCERLVPLRFFWMDRIVVNTLTRRDHLAQALSFVRASATGEWHRVGDSNCENSQWHPIVDANMVKDVETWLIDIHEREARIASYRHRIQARRRRVAAYLYEDLVAKPELVVTKVWGDLSGEPMTPRPVVGEWKRISTERDSILQAKCERLINSELFQCCSHCKDLYAT